MHIERIYPDQEFWLLNVTKIQQFFLTAVLPELIGKFYSRTAQYQPVTSQEPCYSGKLSPVEANQEVESDMQQTYCYYNRPEEGEMVACDNSGCKYQWFHITCLKLNSLPKSKFWYCPGCRKHPEFQRKRKKN